MPQLKRIGGWFVVSLLGAMSLSAAGHDVRLVDAAKNTDKAAIQDLLRQRVDVNVAATDGTTALHWAAYSDDLDMAELLIRAGANAKAANRYGVTPLSLACTNGNAPMIELLLKAGAPANTELPGGETALMTAARTGKVDAVKVLLAAGADVNAKTAGQAQTALMWAADEGHTATVEALLEHGADVHALSKGGFTPLLFAVREGRIGVAKILLKAGADVNEKWDYSGSLSGTSAMVLAVANAHYELAAALLDAGADPNSAAQGWTALHEITWVRKPGAGTNNPAPPGSGNMDSLEFVRRLVAHGANLNARMTKRAKALYSNMNMIGATPFFMAAKTADAPLMRLLAELGSDPLLTNTDNTTPLMAAAGVGTRSPGEDPGTEKEVLEAVKVALELGSDMSAADKNGDTVMHGAAYKQAPSVVQLLMDKGAKTELLTHKNKSGWTPLRIAEGVHIDAAYRFSPETAAVLRQVMIRAGLSTVVDPELNIVGRHGSQ